VFLFKGFQDISCSTEFAWHPFLSCFQASDRLAMF